MSAPTWYDVLGVDRDASTEEIRAAWKSGIADLDPTDRRFRSLSEAAGVLLDPARRAEYDAGLPPSDDLEHGEAEPDAVEQTQAGADQDESEKPTTSEEVVGTPEAVEAPEESPAEERSAGAAARRRPPLVSGWLLTAVAVVAAVCVAAAAVSLSRSPAGAQAVTVANDNSSVATTGQDAGKTITYNHTITVESDGAEALTAAKNAIVPLLSYDYRHMQQSKTAAEAYMTDDFKQKSYDGLFAMLQANAPRTKTVVKCERPVDAGIVGVSPGVVQVLLFVDCPTTNTTYKKPQPYQDEVTVTMTKVGDQWLVNGLTTKPAA